MLLWLACLWDHAEIVLLMMLCLIAREFGCRREVLVSACAIEGADEYKAGEGNEPTLVLKGVYQIANTLNGAVEWSLYDLASSLCLTQPDLADCGLSTPRDDGAGAAVADSFSAAEG